MDEERLLNALKISDKLFANQLKQFWSDQSKHVLGVRLDSNGRIKSIFRIDSLPAFVDNLQADSNLLLVKAIDQRRQPESIRWVTDHEAVRYMRVQFADFTPEHAAGEQDGNQNGNSGGETSGQSPTVLQLYDQILRFTDRPSVLQALTEERSKLMEIILEWSDNLLDLDSEDSNNSLKSSQPLDRIASKIILLKTRETKLLEMLISSTELFSDLLQHSNFRSNLQETVEMLQNEAEQMFSLWQRESNSAVEVGVLTRACIEFVDELPVVTLTGSMISIVEGSHRLASFGLEVNPGSAIGILQQSITPLLAQVKVLQSVVDFYSRIGEEIRPCHSSLLLRPARTFTELLESVQTKSVRWNDGPNRISSWIGMLQNAMQTLVKLNDGILGQHKEMIDILIKCFDDIDTSPTVKQWIEHKLPVSLSRLKTCNEEIKLRFASQRGTLSWRKHIDYQLYKVVHYCMVNATSRRQTMRGVAYDHGDDGQKSEFGVSLQLSSQGVVEYEPSMEAIKCRFSKVLNEMIQLPASVNGLVDWHNEAALEGGRTLFHAFYLSKESSGTLTQFYARFKALSEELIQIKKPFQLWASLYLLVQRIKSDLYEGKYDDPGAARSLQLQGLEEFRGALEQVRKMNEQFVSQFEVVNELHSVVWPELVVSIVPIKMLIKWLVGETRVVVLQILTRQTARQLSQIEKACSETLKRFDQQWDSLEQLLDAELYLAQQLPEIAAQVRRDSVSVKEKIKFAESHQQSVPGQKKVNELIGEFERFVANSEELREQLAEQLTTVIGQTERQLNDDVADFLDRWSRVGDLLKSAPEIVSNFVTNSLELSARIEPLKKAKRESKKAENSGLLFPNYNAFVTVCEEIEKLNGKYGVLRELEASLQPFLDAEWIVSRNKLSAVEGQLSDWSVKQTDRTGHEIVTEYIASWRTFLGAVQTCKGEHYSAAHWTMLLSLLELDNRPVEQIKTDDLYRKRDRVIALQESIKELNKIAVRDEFIEETFRELEQSETTARFQLANYSTKDGKSLQIISNWQEALDTLADCSLLVSSLQTMAEEANQQTQARIQGWEARLSLLQTLLASLAKVQRKWISLEPIFAQAGSQSSGDSFAGEREMFSRNSADFQRLMRQVVLENSAKILTVTFVDSRLEQRLDSLEKQFANIQKKLRTMMESARQRFARFYFLSDEDLLLILSGKVDLNESGLVEKLFSNTISSLLYDTSGSRVLAIQSVQGEVVPLRNGVVLPKDSNSAAIESGLSQLAAEIEATLLYSFQRNFSQISAVYSDAFWAQIPSQLLSLFCWIDFTTKIEYAIPRNSLMSVQSEYEKYLKGFTDRQERERLEDVFNQQMTSGQFKTIMDADKQSRLFEMKVRQTVLDLIHFLQVIERLQRYSVTNVEDWQWQQELRFYASSPNSSILVRMGVATIEYSFANYLGAIGDAKLVHTELTNNCFLTMTQAAALGLGANPYGPAGTGKTETVKALGAHLGRQVLVFNCDEAIDTRSMVRILLGIVQCGAWACFDEFNRLQLDVLSVLSTLIGTVQDALKSGKSKLQLPAGLSDVSTVTLNHNAAIFITLNPAGKHYGARNELPDNLKALFLPVSMSAPDLKDIIDFLLVAQGFTRAVATVLARKLCIFFDFAAGALSVQRHYDWGLRAMKACVLSAGQRFRPDSSKEEQFEVLIESLREQIVAKLVEEDVQQFELLLRSVFGSQADNHSLENTNLSTQAIEEAAKELSLTIDDNILQKVRELHSQLNSRLGVVLFGPTASGKTTAWKLLKKSLELASGSNEKVKIVSLSPKSVVPKTKLFGTINPETRDWIDGLFSAKARTELSANGGQKVWFILDGQIDPEWVEALNSVLDDNRVLTLASGERITFDASRCNIIFECSSLRHASPATISRLGVMCFSPSRRICQYLFGTTNALIGDILVQETNRSNIHRLVSSIRTLKACEGSLELQSLFHQLNSEGESPELINVDDDYRNVVMIDEHVVETSNITPLRARVEPILESQQVVSLLICGPNSCGKSSFVEATVLSKLHSTVINYNCGAQSDAKDLAGLMLKAGTLKRTREGNQCLNFGSERSWLMIENWELLSRDKWNDNSLEALLLYILSYGAFYHPETFELIQLERLSVILACSDLGQVDVRLQSRCHVFQMAPLNVGDIAKIVSHKANSYRAEQLAAFLPGKLVDCLHAFPARTDRFNLLNMSLHALRNLVRTDALSEDICERELSRIFGSYLTDPTDVEAFHRSFPPDDNSLYFPDISNDLQFRVMNSQEVPAEINKLFNRFNDDTVPITRSTIELFQALTPFLTRCDPKDGSTTFKVETMILVGNRGNEQQKICSLLAEQFQYEVWSANSTQNERQLVNDLKQLLSAGNDDKQDRHILLYLDQLYLECLPFVGRQILGLFRPNGITSDSKKSFFPDASFTELPAVTVKIVITKDCIEQRDVSDWLRGVVSVAILSRPQAGDYKALSDGALKESPLDGDSLREIFVHFTGRSRKVTKGDEDSNNNGREDVAFRGDVQSNMLMFTSYVQSCVKLFAEHSSSMTRECERLESGVVSLDAVSEAVRILKDETTEKKVLLDAKRKDADEAFQMIVHSMQSSEDKRDELEKLQVNIAGETKVLKEQKKGVDEELAQIEPLLEKAKQSVGSIKNEALSEVRSLRAPPTVVRDILEGVLRLLGVKDTSWNSMKNYLSRKGIAQIVNFDPAGVSTGTLNQVEQLLEARGASFEPANAKRASLAAASLAEWVTANVRYGQVMAKVKPYQAELERLESKLNGAQIRLKTLGLEMESVDGQVEALRGRMQTLTVEAAQIEMNVNESNRILEASELLVSQLGAEHKRWREKLSTTQQELAQLPQKLCLSAAYSKFAPMFEQQSLRTRLWNDALFRFIPEVDVFTAEQFFGRSQTECFLSLTDSKSVLLIDDPHGKILESLGQGPLEKSNFDAKDCYRQIELSQRLGKTLLIENAAVRHFSDAKVVELLFGSRFERNPAYKLLISVTDISGFQSLPAVLSLTRQLHLGGSFESTVESLLATILQVTAPTLEREIAETQKTIAEQRKRLAALEDDLLGSLADRSKDGKSIVQDDKLIEKLRQLKQSSGAVEEAMHRSTAVLEESLRISSDKYRPLAETAARLLSILECLTVFSSVYHIGFAEYGSLIQTILQQASSSSLSDELIDERTLIQAVFDYVSRSLFPPHQRALAKLIGKEFAETYPTIPKHDLNDFLKQILDPPGPKKLATSVLIITGKGENVIADISRIAGNSLVYISLGVSTVQSAEMLLRQSSGQTRTVCLANLHLVSDWLATLSRLLSVGRQFSVVLVSEMCEHLPNTLLEQCRKYVHSSGGESTFGSRPPDPSRSGEPAGKLELVHWVVTERRLYVPIGWSKQYEFANADRLFGQQLLELIQRKLAGTAKHEADTRRWLIGLLGRVIYGAKLERPYDRAILDCILERCLARNGPKTGPTGSYLRELELPENVSRVRSRSIQEELGRNFGILQRFFSQRLDALSSDAVENGGSLEEGGVAKAKVGNRFGLEYFSSLWKRVLQKCKITLLDDLSLEFADNLEPQNSPSIRDSPAQMIVETIHHQERSNCVNLIRIIHGELLGRAQQEGKKGLESSLRNNQTPASWSDAWTSGSPVAQQFIIDVARMYRKLSAGPEDSSIDLRQCLNAFSTFRRIEQLAASFLGVCLDELTLECHWNTGNRNGVSNDGFLVELDGIAVEGAQFEQGSNRLVAVSAESAIVETMPTLALRFAHVAGHSFDPFQTIVQLPLFADSSRQVLITDKLSVSCQPDMQMRFIEMGVAFVLAPSD